MKIYRLSSMLILVMLFLASCGSAEEAQRGSAEETQSKKIVISAGELVTINPDKIEIKFPETTEREKRENPEANRGPDGMTFTINKKTMCYEVKDESAVKSYTPSRYGGQSPLLVYMDISEIPCDKLATAEIVAVYRDESNSHALAIRNNGVPADFGTGGFVFQMQGSWVEAEDFDPIVKKIRK